MIWPGLDHRVAYRQDIDHQDPREVHHGWDAALFGAVEPLVKLRFGTLVPRVADGFAFIPAVWSSRGAYHNRHWAPELDPDLSGVLITYVAQNSEANTYGLTPGNVVIEVQGVPVTTPDEVWQADTQAQEQHRSFMAVLVQTNSGPQWLSFSISATKS